MPDDVWNEEAAARYDLDAGRMNSPEVLGPTLDFLLERAAGGRILEFAVGTGRVAVPLHERGAEVIGIELSEPMAARVREKVGDAIPVVIGDMSTATAPGEFSLVLLVFNTISNLLTQAEQVACFANAARHLAPGGAFVIECFVPPLRRLPPGQLAAPFEVTEEHLGLDTYDLVEQRLTSHHYWTRGGVTTVFRSEHRYVWPSELDLMARLAGLELVERVADWDGSPFTDDSTSALSVWRKAA
jgi:SAM-dependent methyltransferase